MRVAIVGNCGVGKSTLVEAFKKRWPMYGYPVETYRDLIKNSNHSSNTTQETQLIILDWMLQIQDQPKDSKIIFDRCTYDNLVYTLYANEHCKYDEEGVLLSGVSDEVCAATISLVRESMKNIDLIFWIKRDNSIQLNSDGGRRDINDKFIQDTDKIYQDLMHHYSDNLEADIFFPSEDCPAILQVEGNTIHDRLAFISEFLDQGGDLIETETSILNPQNLDILEQMIKDQKGQQVSEDQLQEVMKKLKY